MSVIYILLSVSVVIGVAFFVIFIMAVRSGQYDDDYTPSVRMLFEDELVKEQTNTSKQTKTD
ncbi:cbb3-type cytochrome oxidase assembly protein CcoS [Winogradskyella sp. PC D3.3]